MSRTHWLVIAALTSLAPHAVPQQDLADALKNLDARVYPAKSDDAKELQEQVGKWLRGQRDQVNRRDIQAWDAIKSKEDWEHFRDARIAALKRSLGTFRPGSQNRDGQGPTVHITKTIPGDGFVIENHVYESRPGLWVTANLYCPAKPLTPSPSPQGGEGRNGHPAILIIHSHHNPKTQGELQDMGMTWARQGCYVLVPDQLGHGERRAHPFIDLKSYPTPYKTGRQDYFFRYNTAMQLHLIGESLIGWMANDMMRGLDVLHDTKALYTKSPIDKKAIILLGSVAGGGDPAGVTAAIDPRITCVAPFNFGGPQPETKFPLPADARQSFNYMGGGSWESTRGLRLSGRDGFLPWVIVGSVAPRALIHAHEFAWDAERDPVWDRYRQIFKWYGAGDKLSFAKGAGSVSKSGPGNTHCNNIGAVHRQPMHPLFEQWFKMPQAKEYSKRVPSEELQCLTPEMREKIKYAPLHEVAGRIADEQLESFRKQQRGKPKENQRQELAQRWKQLLGAPNLGEAAVSFLKGNEALARVGAQRGVIKTKDVVVPFLKLEAPKRRHSAGVIVAVAQEGKAGFLKHRAETIARLLDEGATVILPDLPGCGEAANPGEGRGRTSGSTSQSASAQMLGTTMLGLRLHCLQRVLEVARLEADGKGPVKLWGDSFAPVNGPDVRIEVPYDVDKTPSLAEPGGPLLALLAGVLSDVPIESIYTRGGLVSLRSILDSQFIYVPHDVAIPGALLAGDLDDLAAAYLSQKGMRLAIESPVDGVNRAAGQGAINRAYSLTIKVAGKDAARLRLSAETSSAAEAAAWLRGASAK